MASIEIDGEVETLRDGDPILDACYGLGVPFGCQAGECATCVVEVAEGMENLEPPNHAEQAMGLAPHQRLACQARIKSGHVRLRW